MSLFGLSCLLLILPSSKGQEQQEKENLFQILTKEQIKH